MKKVKDPDAKRLQKIRSALRGVWQYDPLRKAVITQCCRPSDVNRKMKVFLCPLCNEVWPFELATVDHEPELGSFTLATVGDWINRLFFGPQRAVCKPCHKRKPKARKQCQK